MNLGSHFFFPIIFSLFCFFSHFLYFFLLLMMGYGGFFIPTKPPYLDSMLPVLMKD